MNICDQRHIKCLFYFVQYFKGRYIAYTGKTIEAAAVCLSVRRLKYQWYLQALTYGHYFFCGIHDHLLTFYNAWASQQKEIISACILSCKKLLWKHLFRIKK